MAKSKHISPIYAVSGSQGFLRRRQILVITREQAGNGWRIDHIDGAIKGELRAALSQGGVFFTDQILVVVRNPEKADLKLYEKHLSVVDPDIVLLLNYDGDPKGNTKFGKFLKNLGKYHQAFPVPEKTWDAEKVAVAFCTQEAKKQYDKKMTEILAGALVGRLGVDLGVLSFEIWKMAILSDLDKSDEITNIHARQGIAVITEAGISPVVDALAVRQTRRLFKLLNRVKQTSKKDPTMGVCRLIGKQAVQWLAAADLRDRGIPVADAVR
jgi:hypothetical protein